MSGPRLATDNYGRRYLWPPTGQKMPSVTTIINQAAKPALKNWAAKMVATYAVDNILNWEGLPRDDAIDLLKREPLRYTQKRMDIGSAVHAALEAWVGADPDHPPMVDIDLVPYVAGGVQWLDDMVAKVLHTEVTIFNLSMAYAGTCDLIVELKDGRVAIADWKSGKALYEEVGWQLAAYAHGEFIAGYNDDTEEWFQIPMPPIATAIGVHVPGDGGYTAKEVPLVPRRFREFMALRTLQKWQDDEKHAVFGQVWVGQKEATHD